MTISKAGLARVAARSLLATTCLLAWAGPVLAQEQPSEEGGLGDIVVTAQKRSQSAQDVGITMSVVTPDVLAKHNIREVTELASVLPNVQINYGVGQNSFNVRGIGVNVFAGNFDPPIAVHIDDVYLSKSIMTPLLIFDLDRVEALKGPQGTLFGRNTTGGALNFYSRKPTDHFTAGATVGYDDYETVRAEGYVSGPLTDTLSARLSGFGTRQGQGYYKNTLTGKTEGWERKYAVRGQLAWNGEATDALLSVTYGRDYSQLAPYDVPGVFTPASLAAGTPTLCAPYLNGTLTGADADCRRLFDGGYPGDKNPYTTDNNLRHQMRAKQIGATARIEHDLGWSKLVSISSYQKFRRFIVEDSDSTPVNSLDSYEAFNINQYSQEIRLSQNKPSRWNYVLGAYYEHDDLASHSGLIILNGATDLYTEYTQKVNARAIFFHNDYAITDQLSLIAGVRYSSESIRINGGTWLAAGLTTTRGSERPTALLFSLSTSSAVPGGGKRHDENVSYKVGAEWKPKIDSPAVDKFMLYANVSSGFRSGAFNVVFADSQAAFTSLSPEKITAYEAGFKSVLAGRTVQFNGAVFHYDFKNGFINVDSPTSPVPVTTNAAGVKTDGVELDLQWRPIEGLQFGAAGGWLHSKINSAITAGGRNLQGNSTVNSPKWTFTGDAAYTTALNSDLKLNLSVNANYRSSQFLQASNSPVSRISSYWLVGAQMGVAATDDRWAVSVWAKNLTKSVYKTYLNDLPGLGIVLASYGPPRVIGGTLSVKY